MVARDEALIGQLKEDGVLEIYESKKQLALGLVVIGSLGGSAWLILSGVILRNWEPTAFETGGLWLTAVPAVPAVVDMLERLGVCLRTGIR